MERIDLWNPGGASARLASTNLFDTAVIFHPASISMEQMQAIKIPIAFGCAEGKLVFWRRFSS
jgi:dienelactone hydrolase